MLNRRLCNALVLCLFTLLVSLACTLPVVVPATATPSTFAPAAPPPTAVIPATATLRQERTPVPTLDQRTLNPENGHLYLLDQNVTSWHRARQHCTTLGGHLVTIDSEAENTFVYGFAICDTWLGATDEAQEGTWVWVTGEPWTYTNWQDGQPDNCCPPEACGGTDCMEEHYLTYSGGMTWIDVPNTNQYRFVCEWDNP